MNTQPCRLYLSNDDLDADILRCEAGGWRSHTMSAAELRRRQFPPISYVIPGLIPEGLSIAAGRPKVGKSWLGLDLALAVAGGGECLGGRQPAAGDVLYAALEDNPRRLQRRIDKIISPFAAEWPERLTLTTSWRRLDQGGVDDVGDWADSVAEPRLVILDTLAGVRPVRTTNGYAEDYDALTALHRLANDRGLAILVLHHTRKMDADDPVDTVSGTLGLTGCADTVLVLARSPQGTTLYVRGRDIEEAEHAVTFDKATCHWTILGEASEVRQSETRTAILAVLEVANDPMGPGEIAAATSIKENTVKQRLMRMVADGQAVKVGRGQYAHPRNLEGGRNDRNFVTKDEKALHSQEVRKVTSPQSYDVTKVTAPGSCQLCGEAGELLEVHAGGPPVLLHRACINSWTATPDSTAGQAGGRVESLQLSR
jgi:hypothetical protein